MSWGLFSERIFNYAANSTPVELGPGCYNTFSEARSFKQMKAPFNYRSLDPAQEDFVPCQVDLGPGKYDPIEASKQNPIRSVFVSHSQREQNLANETPDPTLYQTLSEWASEPKKDPIYRPPPVTYPNSGFIGQSVIGYTIAEDKCVPIRKKVRGSEWVGPGTYETENQSSPQPITMDRPANRDLYMKGDNVPAPGTYQPSEIDTKIPITICKRPKEKPPEETSPVYLGPEEWKFSHMPQSAFASRVTRDIFSGPIDTPPCTKYNTNTSSLRPATQAGFDHSVSRKPIVSETVAPGPGFYNPLPPQWVKSHKPMMRKAVDRPPKPSIVPGPGAYKVDEEMAQNRPSPAFEGRQLKRKIAKSSAPGPQTYQPYSPSANGRRIMNTRYEKEGNWIEESKIITPSPGQYDPDTESAGQVHAIQLRRKELSMKNDAPDKFYLSHGSLMKSSFNSSIPKYWK